MQKIVSNPFALLWAASAVQPKFGRFSMRHTRGQATIAFYTDETTPGNNLRPDKGRSYEALLWTIAELPEFFRLRKHGWFKYGYMLSNTLKHIRGGMSAIVKAMLLNFSSKDVNEVNFKTSGLRLPTETDVFGHILLHRRRESLQDRM